MLLLRVVRYRMIVWKVLVKLLRASIELAHQLTKRLLLYLLWLMVVVLGWIEGLLYRLRGAGGV